MGRGTIGCLLALLLLQVANAAPLECPEGTKPESRFLEKLGQRNEFCRDPRTGLKEGPSRYLKPDGTLVSDEVLRAGKPHGPARLYDASGQVVITEIVYENGKQASGGMTLAGLQDIANQRNAAWKQQGRKIRMIVLDVHRLRFQYTAGLLGFLLPEDPDEVAEMRAQMVADGRICEMFPRMPQLRSVEMQYVNTSGEVLTEFELLPGDCLPGAR